MIRLAHPDFHFVITFEENQMPILIVEEPVSFRQYVTGLMNQSKGDAGSFVLSRDWEPIPFDQVMHVVTDVFTLNLNDRKLLGALSRQALALANQGQMIEETHKLNAVIMDWVYSLENSLPYPVAYDDEPDTASLLKAVNLRFDEGSFAESLEHFMFIITELTKTEVICLVNCYRLFSPEELGLLWKAISYRKIGVFLLESVAPVGKHPWERRYIVDKDLCELYPDEDSRGF